MKLTTVIARIIAVFGTSALSALAGGAILGVDLIKAAGMAGFMATATVVEKVLRAYYEDGQLTKEELDAALGGKK
jgi:uncharacterized membrane protein YdjX (TVP38/TMEM64 family)